MVIEVPEEAPAPEIFDQPEDVVEAIVEKVLDADAEPADGLVEGEIEDEASANDEALIEEVPVVKSATCIQRPKTSLQQEQPVSRVRTLRAGAGGDVAWSRSESEAEETGGRGRGRGPGGRRGGQDGAGGGLQGGQGVLQGGRGRLQGGRGRLQEGRGGLCGGGRGQFGGMVSKQRGGRMVHLRGRGGGAQRRRVEVVELPGFDNCVAETGGQEHGRGDGQEDGKEGERVSKEFIWFPTRVSTPSAKPSPEKKRKRIVSEKEDKSEDDSNSDLSPDEETEENDEEEATPDEGDESDEDLKRGLKVSRRGITSRKRQFIRNARAAAKVAKNDDTEDGYEGENDGGDSSDDEVYLPPGAQKLPKTTRGAGRRSFNSLAYRRVLQK